VAHALVRAARPRQHHSQHPLDLPLKGRVCDDGEMLLLIKTRSSNFESVRETIHKVNTYELPEVLAYRVDWASPGFAQSSATSWWQMPSPISLNTIPFSSANFLINI
jgi:hypothetical protein